MKTSLVLDDTIFNEAKKESLRTGRTLSQVVSAWAALGRETLKAQKSKKKVTFTPLNLGAQKIDLSSRKEWMSELEDD
jgi:hypothetical protein